MVKPVTRPQPRHWDAVADRLKLGEERAEIALRHIDLTTDCHLDVGTGQGQFLARLSAVGIVCVGLDYGFASTRICRENGFKVVQADGRYLPYSDATFTSLSLLDVVEHMPDPERSIREVARVLKAGGSLILTTPNKYSIQEILLVTLRRLGVVSYKQPYDEPVSLRELLFWLREGQLEVQLVKRFGCRRYYLVKAVKKEPSIHVVVNSEVGR